MTIGSHKMQQWRLALGRLAKPFYAVLLLVCVMPAAHGQFLGIGGGRQLSRNLGDGATSGTMAGSARARFSNGSLFALDAGVPVFPFVSAGLHYSFANADLRLERGDAFGSSAEAQLSAHTITVDTRARTPFVYSIRLFALAGVGLTRFGLNVKREVEVPFPGGAPDGLTSFVFTYGAGVERHLHQLVHLRLEVRDYLTPISDQLFRPGGSWHRVVIVGGITLGL